MDNISSNSAIINPIQQSSMERVIHLSKMKDRSLNSPPALRKVAEELEGLFISQMINHMFKGIKTDGLTGEEMVRRCSGIYWCKNMETLSLSLVA